MRIKIIFILLFILAGFVYGAIPSEERAALIALYESTNGDGWTNKNNWKGNQNEPDGFSKIGSEGTWYGIAVVSDHVTSVDLNNNNLAGTIPVELGNLPNLSQLYLYFNRLSGAIPAELGNFKNLKRLYLFNNQLTGSIPPELGNLSNLIGLSLVFNQLSGEIPKELGNLSKLRWFYLSYNRLEGSIPGELGQLKKLEELYLNDNQLSGTIPPELGKCTLLQTLYLSSNQLMGNIPGELGNLKKLQFLILNNNMLTDNIPPEIGNLTSLKKLYLNYNILEGEIPPDLGKLSKLEELYLNDNFLDGTIPSDLGDLSSLKILYLSSNRLTGSIPDGLCDLNSLLVLRLNSNGLQGDIPVKIKSLDGLLDYSSDFRWNLLSTGVASVVRFLNSKQWGGKWENTQTLTVTNVLAQAVSANSIKVSWTPILYSDDPGGYDVYYSLNSNESNAPFISTLSKSQSSLEVPGLTPSTTYYFAVQTRTDPHSNNNNTVRSDKSADVSATTLDANKTISGKVIDAAWVGVEGVILTFSNQGSENNTAITGADGTYEHQVPNRWSGKVTPSKNSSFFSPGYMEYSNVTEDKTEQNYYLILSLSLSATWEEDKTAIIKINYGKIKLRYTRIDPEGLVVKKFTIYRKVSGGVYEEIKSFPNPAVNSGEMSYNDKYLDRNETYTYIVRALDAADNVLVESNEITISANK
jgi:Leucine-rich repeat (LRR) protein